jgi:hypothetical protein
MHVILLAKDGGDFYLYMDVAEFLLSKAMEGRKKLSELSLLDGFLLADFMWNKKLYP